MVMLNVIGDDMTMNIPDLPVSPLIESDGYPTAQEYQFRQNLIQALQSVTSDEGLVPPSQDSANITIIQDGTNTQGEYTCKAGTLIYNTDTNQLQVCILVGGIPTFKNISYT
jgi:hypothetical protein